MVISEYLDQQWDGKYNNRQCITILIRHVCEIVKQKINQQIHQEKYSQQPLRRWQIFPMAKIIDIVKNNGNHNGEAGHISNQGIGENFPGGVAEGI